MDPRDIVLGNLVRAIHILEDSEYFPHLIPEVRVNIVYALEDARTVRDVAGIDGRITIVKGRARASGYPRFGASSHMARLILEVMKYDRSYRAGINFLWTPELSRFISTYSRGRGWRYIGIDRGMEPHEVRVREGLSIPWKIKVLYELSGGEIPRIFYESEAPGKEPLHILLGRDAVEVAVEVVSLAEEWVKHAKLLKR